MIEKDTIKGLECCLDEKIEKCDECPYCVDTIMCKRRELFEDSLDLINHKQELLEAAIAGQETLQKALTDKDRIIKRLNDEKVQLIRAFSECQTEAARVLVEKDKEIERLKNELFCLVNERDSIASRNETGELKMRDYLFRGKRIDNGEWIEGCGIIATENWVSIFTVIDDIDENSSEINEIEVIPETVGQYTGLTDKNGRKIFEGDIVYCSDIDDYYYPEEKTEFVGTVVFESGAFGIATKDTLRILLENWCENDNFVSFWEIEWNEYICSVEIIGNIHDSPELLKGGEEE